MTKYALSPPGFGPASIDLRFSAGIVSNGHVFLTGMTGANADGTMPDDPEAQFRNCWRKIGMVLAEAGLGFEAIVEMTSYHIGLRGHFDVFDRVRLDHVNAPYPAWTAVEVAGLRREGAIVEVRIIAEMEPAR